MLFNSIMSSMASFLWSSLNLTFDLFCFYLITIFNAYLLSYIEPIDGVKVSLFNFFDLFVLLREKEDFIEVFDLIEAFDLRA